MLCSTSKLPLVVILGATGSGKTKLSLELARLFGGEIIGADSMQVYRGLDIITAKATVQEQSAAPHHLIDILNPDECFTVVEYRNKALKIIDDLFEKRKTPIVVGGTNYYIESILWKILIDDPNNESNFEPVENFNTNSRAYEYNLPSEELHKILKSLDPSMAMRLHPNNKRKILRSLEVLRKNGIRHSDILSEQQNSPGGSQLGGGLRYSNSIVLWLQCDQMVLDERLNKRVDTMIEQGLLNELTNFHKQYNMQRITENEKPDYTKGIFQSIGLKEFHDYLILDDNKRNSDCGKVAFNMGLEQLKMVTRRYARTQVKWIKNRFLSKTGREVPPVYALDTTNILEWDRKVQEPAVNILNSFLVNLPCSIEPLPITEIDSQPNAMDITFNCEICDRIFIGQYQWNLHKKSNRHKRMLQSKLKKDKSKSNENE